MSLNRKKCSDEQRIGTGKKDEQQEITISGAGRFTIFHTISRYT